MTDDVYEDADEWMDTTATADLLHEAAQCIEGPEGFDKAVVVRALYRRAAHLQSTLGGDQ